MANEIKVRVSSIDGFSKSRKFKTLSGAQRFAQKYVGEHPEISLAFGYAVSSWGTTKVSCSDCSIEELFPTLVLPKLCPKCERNPATEPHECPYAKEINGKADPEHCTCCEECEQICADEI